MDSVYRGRWTEGGGVDGGAGQGVDTLKQKKAMVCSWKYRKEHSVLVKMRLSLAAVSHQVYFN